MFLLDIGVGGIIGLCILFLFIGLIIGIFFTSSHLKKQIRENPPITEKQIRYLYKQQGKKLSEAQVQRIMREIQQQK